MTTGESAYYEHFHLLSQCVRMFSAVASSKCTYMWERISVPSLNIIFCFYNILYSSDHGKQFVGLIP